MRRCEFCRHGEPRYDAGNDQWYRACNLIPPHPTPVTQMNLDGVPMLVTAWVRPSMSLYGWCGQFRFSLMRWIFRDGSRT